MPEREPIPLPPAAQHMLVQLQTFQQQYQTIALQRETLTIQKLELEKALEALSKTADKEDVFKTVGPVLIKATKANLVKELSEKKEDVETRLKSVVEREKKLREKIAETQSKLQAIMSGKEKGAS